MGNFEKQRINTLLPKNIIQMIDEFAESTGLSRGNAISVIVKQYVDQQRTIEAMSKISSVEQLIEQLEKENSQNE